MQESHYIYTVKNRFAKGANRLCTSLYHVFKKVKTSDHSARFARKCVLIADNYGENKNADVLCFLFDTVLRGWYDEVEFLFALTGHTHNGSDSVHYIHNCILGDFIMATLGEVALRTKNAWSNDNARPELSVLDHQLDWKKYYGTSIHDRLAGFATQRSFTSPSGHSGVHAFRIFRTDDGTVELRWKRDAGLEKEWLGVDGTPTSPGFVLLNGLPVGVPKDIPALNSSLPKQYLAQVTGARMMETLKSCGKQNSMTWIKEAATTGKIPVHRYLEGTTPPGKIGRRFETGAPGRRGELRLLEPPDATTAEELWKLPTGVNEFRIAFSEIERAGLVHNMPIPPVGYHRVPRDKRPTFANHARQVERQQQARQGRDPAAGISRLMCDDGVPFPPSEEDEAVEDDESSKSSSSNSNSSSSGVGSSMGGAGGGGGGSNNKRKSRSSSVNSRGKKPRRKASKKKKASALVPSTNNWDGADYAADMENCKIGDYAVVQCEFAEGTGIVITRVKELLLEEESFTSVDLQCTKGVPKNDPSCLRYASILLSSWYVYTLISLL